jgi:hypothetical protein
MDASDSEDEREKKEDEEKASETTFKFTEDGLKALEEH